MLFVLLLKKSTIKILEIILKIFRLATVLPAVCRLSLALGALGTTAFVSAQEFPKGQTITIVVGFVPGGGTDTATRIVAKSLSANLGQPVVVENRAGAGGVIATHAVANAKPDGTTLLLGTIGPMTVSPHLMKMTIDPLKDLAPITMGVNFPNVLVVPQDLKIDSLAEFIAAAKKDPGKLTYASTGVGSAAHLAGELLAQRAGVEMTHVPYKGGSAAMLDLLSGRITSYYSTPSTSIQHVEAKKLKAIATTGVKRTEFMPEVPTIAESGFPEFNATNWYAFVAPGKTPAPILDRWNTEIVKVLNDPEVRAQLNKHGLTPDPSTRQELADFMAKESATWKKVVTERNIKLE
jgi:tripartite-type tricarboxylate transporter receptor subunit TctC